MSGVQHGVPCPPHQRTTIIPDGGEIDGKVFQRNMMCLDCGCLYLKPATWQLRAPVRVE